MMNLRDLVEKAHDADLLREMIGFAAERLMDLEVGAVTGAAYGEKNPARRVQRNGYRVHEVDALRRCFQNSAARLAAMNVQAVVSRA
jgi:transposase-like protein